MAFSEANMEKYKMLCELIRKEQFGEEITEEEKAMAVSSFLNGRNDSEEIIRYKRRMHHYRNMCFTSFGSGSTGR